MKLLNKDIHCRKLVIETNGHTAATKIFVDGEQMGLVQEITFKASVEESVPEIKITRVKRREQLPDKLEPNDKRITEVDTSGNIILESVKLVFDK